MTAPLGPTAVKLLGLALLLQGCAGQWDGSPAGAGAGADAVDLRTLGERAMVAIRSDCLRSPSPADRPEDAAARRNRLLGDLMLAIDMRHNEYERALMRARGPRNPLARSELRAVAGLTAALTRGEGAVRGDGPGPRMRARRERLRDGILAALWTQMRANRAAARAEIMRGLALPYERWNTCLALSGAIAYEQAGTLDAAIAALAGLAETAARAAEAALIER